MADLDAIYREHADTVYRFLLAKTGSAQLSEELTQETFYLAVKNIERFDGSCKMSTWLCGIAKNALLTHYHKTRHREVPLEEAPEQPTGSAEEAVLSGMNQEAVLTAIHRLSEPGREIVHLRLLGGLSFRQIAAVFGQSETWARVNYYRAKQVLIKELNENV